MLGVQLPLTVPAPSSTVPANETPSIVQTAVCVPPLSENVALRLTVVPNGYDVSDAGPMPVGTAACVSAGATTTGMDWPSPASLLPMILGIAAAVPTMRHVVHATIRVLVMNFFIFHTPLELTRYCIRVVNSPYGTHIAGHVPGSAVRPRRACRAPDAPEACGAETWLIVQAGQGATPRRGEGVSPTWPAAARQTAQAQSSATVTDLDARGCRPRTLEVNLHRARARSSQPSAEPSSCAGAG